MISNINKPVYRMGPKPSLVKFGYIINTIMCDKDKIRIEEFPAFMYDTLMNMKNGEQIEKDIVDDIQKELDLMERLGFLIEFKECLGFFPDSQKDWFTDLDEGYNVPYGMVSLIMELEQTEGI